MKAFRLALVVMAAVLITMGLSGTASAFHDGGVAHCDGCHSMHTPAAGGSHLLVATDPSSTCLTCHEGSSVRSYRVSTSGVAAGSPPLQLGPGGDFAWLKKTYNFTVRGNPVTDNGWNFGHNIIAADNGYVVDPDNATAPGGTFSANDLSCISCHDPHGKNRRLSDGTVAASGAPIIDSGSYDDSPTPGVGEAVGVYRLLGGLLYITDGNPAYPGNPAAVAPASYNRSENATQTRVAYGKSSAAGHTNWGDWCATCHGNYHSDGNYVHPTDENLGSDVADMYNDYVKTGDLTGNVASSFLSLAPFIQSTGDYATLAANAKSDDSVLTGPASTDQVSCLSCHRAHATGWDDMLRWNMRSELMTHAGEYPGTDATDPGAISDARGRTQAETQAAYYDRDASTFATYQRVLCNKCHGKD